jgi:hypothetical protein
MEYTWEQDHVFTAISKKDEVYIKKILPYLKINLKAKAFYKISLTERGALLEITVVTEDDRNRNTEEGSGDNKEGSKS